MRHIQLANSLDTRQGVAHLRFSEAASAFLYAWLTDCA